MNNMTINKEEFKEQLAESCEGCQHKQECCPRAHKNRTIRMNQPLTGLKSSPRTTKPFAAA